MLVRATCLLALLLSANPVRATGEFVDASSIYETVCGMLEADESWHLVSAVDMDGLERLDLRQLRPGLHYLYSRKHDSPERVNAATRVALLIHGVDEPGPYWDNTVRLLVQDPKTLVFFFVWTKWNRPHSVEYWISRDLNHLARRLAGKIPRLEVVAHSAGGVLMMQALCRKDSSRLCAYDPQQHFGLTVRFHTVASPLGGFGMHGTAMGSMLAGAITTHVGSDVTYYDLYEDLDLTIWFTSYETDGVLKKQFGRDMRFPVFAGTHPEPETKPLPGCTHDTAILHAVVRIFDLQLPEIPEGGVGPWSLIYKEDNQVKSGDEEQKPKAPPVKNEWKSVPDPGWQPVKPDGGSADEERADKPTPPARRPAGTRGTSAP